jgi:hypothetical protein
LSSDSPFWFAGEELLTDLLRAQIHSIRELFARHPGLPEFFDLPEATAQQRAACFALLAHRTLMDEIYETFAGRHEQSPSLGDEEIDALSRTRSLFADDAPAWVLEVNGVAELLPSRVYEQLPEPLRRGGGFYANDPVQTELIASAARELGNVEKIRSLSEMVIDHQLKRLEGRWSLAKSVTNVVREIIVQERESKTAQPSGAGSVTLGGQTRRTINREGWEQRLKLYGAIRSVLKRDPSLQGIEFCAQLDTRHAPPLYDWLKAGQWREGLTWKEAWGDPRLRRKIRRVRQEAMKSG